LALNKSRDNQGVRTSSLRLLFVCIPLVGQSLVSSVPSPSKDVPAFSPSGAIKLPATHFELDISHPDAFKERGDLTVVYDPQTRYYLWRYMSLLPSYDVSHIYGLRDRNEAIYADATGLVEFDLATAHAVKVSTWRADSLDAAAHASAGEAQLELTVIQGGGFETCGPCEHLKSVDLSRANAKGFVCWPFTGSTCQYRPTTIPSVEKQGANWRVVLRNRWDQEINLDSKFNLVSTQRLPSPKQ
jgi:hypothetical protein